MKVLALRIVLTLVIMLSGSAVAAELGPDELGSLVKGQKWLVAMQGNLSDLKHSAYWDFRSDGSMCVRFAGAKPDDRCADEGRWRLDGRNLCWDLKSIGEQYGYKSACVQVKKTGAQEYEALNAKAGYRQFVFRPVK